MRLTMRKYANENDYWRIRQFLREVFIANRRKQDSWPLYRWDYWRWHVNQNIFKFQLEAAVFIWETDDGKIAAVLNPDGPGEAFFQVHPSFHTPQLEVEMTSVAETQFSSRQPDGTHRLTIWADLRNELRQVILDRRGYVRQPGPEFQRIRPMDLPIHNPPTPPGYRIRSLGDFDEHPNRSWVSWKAFHPSEPDSAYQGADWYRNVQRAPLYRRDLDLVAVAPDGTFAAFCTIWFDDMCRTAAFEPVGTHPDHQRLGLGKAVMTEGLRRIKNMGADLALVSSYSEAAGALYASIGFTSYDLSEPWVKTW